MSSASKISLLKKTLSSFYLLVETVQFSDSGGRSHLLLELDRRLIYKLSELGILVELDCADVWRGRSLKCLFIKAAAATGKSIKL